MPGPVSDSYDPEFSTGERAREFAEKLQALHAFFGGLIDAPPVDYRRLPDLPPGKALTACLPEKDWRFIRYALETAHVHHFGEFMPPRREPS
ncbi:MAG: hypothetical protein NCW75_05485 [Phycisphaera sp.]|nr:MAG: hypothetical protein NCW75_05485 [Phycisphaera sp.]